MRQAVIPDFVNHQYHVLRGMGYPHREIVDQLDQALGTGYDRLQQIERSQPFGKHSPYELATRNPMVTKAIAHDYGEPEALQGAERTSPPLPIVKLQLPQGLGQAANTNMPLFALVAVLGIGMIIALIILARRT